MSVNKGIPKVDGMGLVLGKPAFTDDLAPRDALIVKVMRSPHAHANITKIDTHIAEGLPEIKCILTYENVGDVNFSRAGQGFPEPSPYDHRILNKTVRYIGEPVAVVAGHSEKAVDLAISKIIVTYDVLEPVIDFESAIDNSIVIHENDGTSSMFEIGHKPKRNIAAGMKWK